MHPGLEPLAELFKRGKLAIVQGVGYPEPDRSHFRSMEIWHTASTARESTGWLGRFLDDSVARQAKASRERQRPEELLGLALTEMLPQALQADHFAAPVIQSLDSPPDEIIGGAAAMQVLRELSQPQARDSTALAFIGEQAENTFQIRERLRKAKDRYKSIRQLSGGRSGPATASGRADHRRRTWARA